MCMCSVCVCSVRVVCMCVVCVVYSCLHVGRRWIEGMFLLPLQLHCLHINI